MPQNCHRELHNDFKAVPNIPWMITTIKLWLGQA